MKILNVHTQALQRLLSRYLPETYKLPLYARQPDLPVEQQVVHLHNPLHLLVVNDPTLILQAVAHVIVPITAELLLELSLYAFFHLHVVKDLSVNIGRYKCWFAPPFTFTTLAIIGALGNS
jgi:hypothetical protein